MKMNEHLKAFVIHILTEKEKSKNQQSKTTPDMSAGFRNTWMENEITKELVIQYREHLESRNLVHTTINLMLVSIMIWKYVQKPECRVETMENPEEKLCGCKDDGSRI